MPIVDLWLEVASQWRSAPLADGRMHWIGLDYGAVKAGLELGGTAADPATWQGVRVMERAAAAALNGVAG